MRELNMLEIEHVSGGGFFDTLGAMVLGGLGGFFTGAAKGGVSGGSVGGILGLGIISAAVTMLIGMAGGATSGMMFGLVNGWDTTVEVFNEWCMQWADMSLPAPKV